MSTNSKTTTGNKSIKKLLAIVLSLAMAISMLPISALAKGVEIPDTIDGLPAGAVGAKSNNIQMIQCGHEFSFELDLYAKLTESNQTTVTKKPYDVVLVLDRSGSMFTSNSGGSAAKWNAAKNAAKAFVGVVNDYNNGTGAFDGTGTLTGSSASRFGLVTYSDTVTTMKSNKATGTQNFAVTDSGVGALINPSGTTGSSGTTSNLALANNAIDSLTATGTTNIADGINAAKAILDARTATEKTDRPGFIVVMSDGVANRPHNHSSNKNSPNHSTTSIGGVTITSRLGTYISNINSTSHQCNETIPTTHTCSTVAAILQAEAARKANYTVYSVGFDLDNQVLAGGKATAVDTLKKIAGDDARYTAAGVSSNALAEAFANIVKKDITVAVNPVAENGKLTYVAPEGFTIKSVEVTKTGKITTSPVVAANSKSFTWEFSQVHAEFSTLKVTLLASSDKTPGTYNIFGAGSKYEFKNVELNKLSPIPAWYTTVNANQKTYYIDLAAWGKGTVTVLPMAYAADASVTVTSGQREFNLAESDINFASPLFPAGGTLTGSGNVMVGSNKIGTFTTANGVIKVTLTSPLTESKTATLEYTYKSGNLTSCPKTLTIAITLQTTFKVDVIRYYHNGNNYQNANQSNTKSGYVDGADYTWENIGTEMTDTIIVNGKTYYLDNGVNGSTTVNSTDDAEDLEGKINNDNVTIKLYYRKLNLPTIPLTKTIAKAFSDATYPGGSTFSFKLYTYDGNTYTPVTEALEFTEQQLRAVGANGVQKNFQWIAGIIAADMRDADLYILETISGNGWSSSATNYVKYGTLDHIVGWTRDAAFNNATVTNIYNQPQNPPTIILHKFFSGSIESLVPGFDGSVLNCTTHTHGDGTCDNTTLTCGVEAHEHDSLCYDETSCEHGYADASCTECSGGSMDLVCSLAEHTHDSIDCYDACSLTEHTDADHDNYCYIYTFTFGLYNGSTLIGNPVELKLTYAQLEALLNGADLFETVQFPMTLADLPNPGESSISLTIKETGTNYGWTPASDVTGIMVDAYGNVKYPDAHCNNPGYAQMVNMFNNIQIPGFSFGKEVIDGRTGSVDSSYNGEFTFELRDVTDGDILIDTVVLNITNGTGTYSFSLPNYIGKTARLKLVEIAGTETDMQYDNAVFYIDIENDIATPQLPQGSNNIMFSNTLLISEYPVVTVDKNVNTQTENATFNFTYSYTNGNDAPTTGEGSITLTDGVPGAGFTIELPVNYTGILTITEVNDGLQNWEYDANNTRTLEFVLGMLTTDDAATAVSFNNNYYVPSIDLTKEVADDSLFLGVDEAYYTIVVENDGAEDLQNVVIKDELFNTSVKVFDANNDEMIAGTDYVYNDTDKTITLSALAIGEKITITYNVTPVEVGAIVNTATVTAERTITVGDKVTDTDTETVTVSKLNSALSVVKQVAEYTIDMNLSDESMQWKDSISFSTSGKVAVFKITVKNTGEGILRISDIKDTFAGRDLADATFYYNNDSYNSLADLLDAVRQVELINEPGCEVVFYYITNALTTRDTYTNTVTIDVYDTYEDRDSASDSASVIVSWNNTPTPGPEPEPPVITPDPEPVGDPDPEPIIIAEDPEVPLAALPPKEEEVEIFEEDPPLTQLPQTGVSTAFVPFALGGLGLLGAGLLLNGKKKDENEI